jgi:redox-sensitive bicupin YhaK (pirin superfamily)
MKMKTIKKIYSGRSTNVGSIKVEELLPSEDGFFDPFLVLHHGIAIANKDIPLKQQGVGPHPHRGFSPVSFIYKGGIHHRDSRGNNHVVYAGGAQWINAGMGIIHSERVPEDIFEHGGVQELIQLWINTPAKFKMQQPAYYPATAEDTPTIKTDDGLTILRIPAGEFENKKGTIPTHSEVTTIMGEMKTDGNYSFSFKAEHHTLLYVLEGELKVNNHQNIHAKELAIFNTDGSAFSVKANSNTLFLIASGMPLNEPIATHGPFVMNTQTEILEAFKDYQLGKMGVLIED